LQRYFAPYLKLVKGALIFELG